MTLHRKDTPALTHDSSCRKMPRTNLQIDKRVHSVGVHSEYVLQSDRLSVDALFQPAVRNASCLTFNTPPRECARVKKVLAHENNLRVFAGTRSPSVSRTAVKDTNVANGSAAQSIESVNASSQLRSPHKHEEG